jgi:hypothetical protein
MQLGRHHTGEPRHFLRVIVDVLPVGGAVAHPADEFDHLGVQAVDAGVVGRLLAELDQLALELLLGLEDDLLDPARMDPAVEDQRLERAAGDFAPYRVEAAHAHRVGGVVDDDVHAGRGLEGADVPALAPDDPAFHFFAGERHRGHGALGRVLGGQALDGHGDDAPGLAIGAALGLLLDVAREGLGLGAGLVLRALQDLAARVLDGQPGDPFELDVLLLRQPVGLPFARAERLLPSGERLVPLDQRAIARLDLLELPLLRAGALVGPALEPLPLLAPTLDLAVEILAPLERLYFGRDQHLLFRRLALARRVGAQPLGLGARGAEDARGGRPLAVSVHGDHREGNDQAGHHAHQRGQQQVLGHGDLR